MDGHAESQWSIEQYGKCVKCTKIVERILVFVVTMLCVI